MPVSDCLVLMLGAAGPVDYQYQCQYQCQYPTRSTRATRVATKTPPLIEARYPRGRDRTKDSGGFINGDDILGPRPRLVRAKPVHSDDGQALPTQPACPISFGWVVW